MIAPLKRWPRMQGLKRRPKPGDVFINYNDARGKRVVIGVTESYVHYVPYDEPKPSYVRGGVPPQHLNQFIFLERACP